MTTPAPMAMPASPCCRGRAWKPSGAFFPKPPRGRWRSNRRSPRRGSTVGAIQVRHRIRAGRNRRSPTRGRSCGIGIRRGAQRDRAESSPASGRSCSASSRSELMTISLELGGPSLLATQVVARQCARRLRNRAAAAALFRGADDRWFSQDHTSLPTSGKPRKAPIAQEAGPPLPWSRCEQTSNLSI